MPDAETDLTGQTLGDFHVLRLLGYGGMGRVYLARQQSLKRDVALKILRDDLAKNPTALQRFQAEAEAVARISHPNIVQVYAVGEQAGVRFMALEFIEGRNLRDYLAKKGPPELPLALAIMRQAAAALQRAGEAGIVHRDIKPENILITRKAEVKVTDFGLSRLMATDQEPLNLTQSGLALGTPLYMAPEQVQGLAVDHRTDLYALGVTCYHLLAGHPPFEGKTAYEVAMKHVQEQPTPLFEVRPDLPPDLCGLVHKLMAKAPADRYATAREVLRDLTRIREGLALGLPAGPLSISLPAGLPPRVSSSGMTSTLAASTAAQGAHNRWPVRILAGLGVLACLGLGWQTHAWMHPVAEPDPAPLVGLPDARPPEKVISGRERELLKVVNDRKAQPTEVAEALIELGLLYVREHRLEEAEQRFADLESERFDRPPISGPPVYRTAARFGRGIVLAHKDQVNESIRAFETGWPGNTPKQRPAQLLVRKFLFERPELARAISEALHRNAEHLQAERKKLPAPLEILRFPAAGNRPDE